MKSETDKFSSFSIELNKVSGTKGDKLQYISAENFDSNNGVVNIIGTNLSYYSGDESNYISFNVDKKISYMYQLNL